MRRLSRVWRSFSMESPREAASGARSETATYRPPSVGRTRPASGSISRAMRGLVPTEREAAEKRSTARTKPWPTSTEDSTATHQVTGARKVTASSRRSSTPSRGTRASEQREKDILQRRLRQPRLRAQRIEGAESERAAFVQQHEPVGHPL